MLGVPGAPSAGPGAPAGPHRRTEVAVGLVAVAGIGVVLAGLAVTSPAQYGVLVAVAAVGLVAVVAGLASPAVAAAYLLVSAFLRLVLPTGPLPTDAFVLAFGGLLLAVAVHRRHGPGPRTGLLGLLVGAYVAWNVVSMLSPHRYDAAYPAIGAEIDVPRFVLIGTVMPLAVLLVGVTTLSRGGAVRALQATVLGLAGYSALVSILQFHGPAALVWPAYALSNPEWPGRAVGVVNQPVVHGLLLTVGYLVALLVASQPRLGKAPRVAAGVGAAACCYAVYLTYTRSAWLCLAVAVVLGVLLARGWRTGFVVTGAAALAGVAANWRTFTSSDRAAGGVASSNELQDRLNINATALWATAEQPVAGWGIGRFPAVNTYHHQQFSNDVPWERGYAIASHLDLLGIAAELGLVGAGLWLALVVLVGVRLVRAVRSLPPVEATGGGFAVVALLAFACWVVTGLTVDQRLFDVTNLVVMALAGAAIGLAAREGRSRRPGPGAPYAARTRGDREAPEGRGAHEEARA